MLILNVKQLMLNTYKKALPCRVGSIVGRIVGESGEGSWNNEIYSIPKFATPQGTVINVGIANLFPLTFAEEIKLREFEAQAQISNTAKYYGNHLTKEDTKW